VGKLRDQCILANLPLEIYLRDSFTYAPRPAPESDDPKEIRRRNALEDFCTEALAWCLIHSQPFAKRLFAFDCFSKSKFRPESFEVDTQASFPGEYSEDEKRNEKPRRNQFDLVLKASAPSSSLVVIECKVAPDKPEYIEEQITRYRRQIAGSAFKNYESKVTLLLTPYADRHNADGHLSWNQVRDALSEAYLDAQIGPEKEVLNQFADFLEIRYIAKVKLPPIQPLLPSFKKIGPLLAGFEAIFQSLRNDDVGRSIFRREDAVIPNMDWDKNNNQLWYGIWSRGPHPTYYMGLYTRVSGKEGLSMWAQIMFDGGRTSAAVPKRLRDWYNKALSGKEQDGTSFVFTKEINADDDNSAAIEEWFIGRMHDIKVWADTLV
jgi:hypothetical protein